MNPAGKDIVRDLVPWIRDTYQFADVPNLLHPDTNQVNQSGLIFERGRHLVNDQFVTITKLTIYDDGIVVEAASSTEDADALCENLLFGAAEKFGLQVSADLVRKRLYVSEVIVKLEGDLRALSTKGVQFAKSIPKYAGRPYEFGGVSFWTDADESGKHAVVRIERQVGREFAEQRFFSHASLQTQHHLALLAEFDLIAKGE
jgi:hypothetical protein